MQPFVFSIYTKKKGNQNGFHFTARPKKAHVFVGLTLHHLPPRKSGIAKNLYRQSIINPTHRPQLWRKHLSPKNKRCKTFTQPSVCPVNSHCL